MLLVLQAHLPLGVLGTLSGRPSWPRRAPLLLPLVSTVLAVGDQSVTGAMDLDPVSTVRADHSASPAHYSVYPDGPRQVND